MMMTVESAEVVLDVKNVEVSFGKQRGFTDMVQGRPAARVRAVNGVSFQIRRHETLGLVGETGSGKTTLGRALMRLYPVDRGQIHFMGQELTGMSGKALRDLRRNMQLVFQDPYSSLNPCFTVSAALAEVLRFHEVCPADGIEDEVRRLLNLVGLSPDMAARRPVALSGGQRQRVGLARALAPRPRFLVLDEPVAALDVSIQAQVLNLLKDLRDELGLTMLFIAHELSVVRHMSTRVAVMYLGKIVELGATQEIFERPSHPYTQSLLRAVPRLVPERRHRDAVLKGEVPSPMNIPSGCPFHPRCPVSEDVCTSVPPPEIKLGPTQWSRCHLAGRRATIT